MKLKDKYIYTCRGYTVVIDYFSQFKFERIEETTDNDIVQAKAGLRDGSSYITSNLQTRQISIYGSIDTLRTDFVVLERQLKKTFTPKYIGLLSYIEDGIEKNIECIPENIVTLKRRYGKIDFKIDLLACNPYWNLKDNINIFNFIEPTFYFDNSLIDTTFAIVTDIQETDIYNEGDVRTGISFYFKARATVVQPYIVDTINNKGIFINRTLLKNDTLEITSFPFNKTVLINGKNSIDLVDFLYSDFFYMEEGRNRFKYGARQNENQMDFTLSYKPLYL